MKSLRAALNGATASAITNTSATRLSRLYKKRQLHQRAKVHRSYEKLCPDDVTSLFFFFFFSQKRIDSIERHLTAFLYIVF